MSAKKTHLIVLLLGLIFPFITTGQTTKIMSYNIKYDNVNDTVNNWNDRKAAMVTLLQKHAPEFIGMQEVLVNQLEYLNQSLPNYAYIGVGRDDGKKKGEFSPILYNTKNYELLASNTFWLSKTPNKISVGWDAALERICTYGLFKNKANNKKIWVFNTHFDHIGTKARKKSTQLILKKIKELNTEKLPVVLMGDFNLMPNEKPILVTKKAMDDSMDIAAQAPEGPKGTFNGFDIESSIDKRIDYIFVKGLSVEKHQHIHERLANQKHVSDHLPVLITLKSL